MSLSTPSIQALTVVADAPLRTALQQLDFAGSGFLLAVDNTSKLVGVLTDGDIRRALLRGIAIGEPVSAAMQRRFMALPFDADPEAINGALNAKITFIPLIDLEGRPIDYASPTRHRRYPVMEPVLDGNEMEYVQECVRTGWISSQGRFVTQFETALARFHGVPYALAVSNGTVALHLALVSLGVGPGDEVIVPDLTFAASANVVLYTGATPVFVDADPQSWNIDTTKIEAAVTPRTRAIMPVHLYGNPCDMDAVCDIARRYNLKIVEDAAESLGARWKGTLTGAFGDAGCFSFFGNKNLTTGEGGAILLRDIAVYERAKMLRDHGMSKQKRYWHTEVGYNYRLTNLQAAVGVAQMERAEYLLSRKREIARAYEKRLAGTRGIVLPTEHRDASSVYWLYTIMVGLDAGMTRDELADRLLRNGIDTRPVFYPMHEMPPYQPYIAGQRFAVAESLAQRGLSLPSAVTLTEADIDNVVSNIKAILNVRRLAGASQVALNS
jgi:perosamine synthetase